jgi:4-diphosphocytidyl-2-C-methyl-D-erythritol kinase
MTRALTLRTPAKINLTLRVGVRRADGFHDVQTVLQSIGLPTP